MKKLRKGFTMVELIFVIVIIGILVSIAMPKLSASREDARFQASLVSLKQALENARTEYLANPAAYRLAKKTYLGNITGWDNTGPDGSCFSVFNQPNNSGLYVYTHDKVSSYSKCDLDATSRTDLYKKALELGLIQRIDNYSRFVLNERHISL